MADSIGTGIHENSIFVEERSSGSWKACWFAEAWDRVLNLMVRGMMGDGICGGGCGWLG